MRVGGRKRINIVSYLPKEKVFGILRETIWNVRMFLKLTHIEYSSLWNTKLSRKKKREEKEEKEERR